MCLRTMSAICEAFIFLYLGLGLVAFGPQRTTYNPLFIFGAMVNYKFDIDSQGQPQWR